MTLKHDQKASSQRVHVVLVKIDCPTFYPQRRFTSCFAAFHSGANILSALYLGTFGSRSFIEFVSLNPSDRPICHFHLEASPTTPTTSTPESSSSSWSAAPSSSSNCTSICYFFPRLVLWFGGVVDQKSVQRQRVRQDIVSDS